MSYFPKSKLKISHTSGGEFIFASSGKPYNGPYIEFSNGTFFAGKNPRRLGEKITKPLPLEDNFGKTKQMFHNPDFKAHPYICNECVKICGAIAKDK